MDKEEKRKHKFEKKAKKEHKQKRIKKKDKKKKEKKKKDKKRKKYDSGPDFFQKYQPFQETQELQEYRRDERQVAPFSNPEEEQLKDEIQVYMKKIQNIDYKFYKDKKRTVKYAQNTSVNPVMIEVFVNDRMGRKERIKCCPGDTIRDLKKLVAAKTGTRWERIKLQKGYSVYKDAITLEDYEVKHGFGFEMYYN